jgi:hypothetical protein
MFADAFFCFQSQTYQDWTHVIAPSYSITEATIFDDGMPGIVSGK